jgi:REP element-mobilizing transposase RayT
MGKMIGYMLTWRTYGTWLEGQKKGYKNERLKQVNKGNLKKQPVKFTAKQKEIVRSAIIQQAQKLSQKVFALTVFSNHIHLLVEKKQESIETAAALYKTAARAALNKNGLGGKIWAKGYDKRYIFTEQELLNRMVYVLKHNE